MTFLIQALPYEPFAPLFSMSEEALRERRAVRVVADACPGYPCRVSLEDASVGEALILVNHAHHTAATPYAASHAIYVRKDAAQALPAPGEVPGVLSRRPLSLRAFDAQGMMVAADLADGTVAQGIEAMMADPAVREVHLHNAKPGCFAAKAIRA